MLTVEEVAKHADRQSCWVIIENRVYVREMMEESLAAT